MSDQSARIAALEREVAAMKAVVARLDGRPAGEVLADPETPSVTLQRAAHQMGITEAAALKRAQRAWRRQRPGVGRFDGRWYFSRAYIDEVRIGRPMSG